jgi:hypothetical protein
MEIKECDSGCYDSLAWREKSMEKEKKENHCQIKCLPSLFEGLADIPPESFLRHIRVFLRRWQGPRRVRFIKSKSARFIEWITKLARKEEKSGDSESGTKKMRLEAGDLIRVRSKEEILATLNPWRQFKNCTFMPDQEQYCGTTQRVLKRLERFVDERDYRVKKASGIVLLEGLNCQGTSDYGRCDRACFYFWREEWLDRIGDETEKIS